MSLKHMKSLIVLVVGLLSVGCATVKDIYVQLVGGKPNTPEQKQKILRDSVVGEYELKHNGHTIKIFCLENGVCERYENNSKKLGEDKWLIVNKEIHIKYDDMIGVFRINPDKSITYIADIVDGKRKDLTKDKQFTFKKIK